MAVSAAGAEARQEKSDGSFGWRRWRPGVRRCVEGKTLEAGALAGGADRGVDASQALHELVCGLWLGGDCVAGFGLGVCVRGLQESAGSLEARVDVG